MREFESHRCHHLEGSVAEWSKALSDALLFWSFPFRSSTFFISCATPPFPVFHHFIPHLDHLYDHLYVFHLFAYIFIHLFIHLFIRLLQLVLTFSYINFPTCRFRIARKTTSSMNVENIDATVNTPPIMAHSCTKKCKNDPLDSFTST